MTLISEQTPVASWNEPDGIAARGTLIVIPGRGERPELYERFGRRASGDGYRVRVVADPVQDEALTTSQVLAEKDGPRPHVLVGSDTGALFAAGLVASGRVTEVDALVLSGLPSGDSVAPTSWEEELAARTACPTHRARLKGRPSAVARCISRYRKAGPSEPTWPTCGRRCSAFTAPTTRSAR